MTDKDFDERKPLSELSSFDKYTFIYFKNLNYVEMVLKPSRLVINPFFLHCVGNELEQIGTWSE